MKGGGPSEGTQPAEGKARIGAHGALLIAVFHQSLVPFWPLASSRS